jgi:hypothetical protein
MINKKYLVLSFVITATFFSCEKSGDPDKGDIRINEVLPVNTTIASDQNGEFDDWIELYNLSSTAKDLSGYFLSDNKDNFSKWEFPSGSTIPGNGYLIIWADNDTTQAGLHANFKLSSLGEDVLLSAPDGTKLDKVEYPGQTFEISYSRNPDGTGAFKWQAPTFNGTNNASR